MNEDMSEMIKKFSMMMNNQEMPDNLKNMLNSVSSSTGNSSDENNKYNNCNDINNNNNYSDNTENSDNDFGNFSNSNNSNSNSNNNNNNSDNRSNNFNNPFGNIDMNTILKMQHVMNSMNDKQNDSRTNLLMSLKPYLKESRKNKVDQYIQLMKMGKIFEIMNPLGGDNKHV